MGRILLVFTRMRSAVRCRPCPGDAPGDAVAQKQQGPSWSLLLAALIAASFVHLQAEFIKDDHLRGWSGPASSWSPPHTRWVLL
jgi:hypothetical protein